TKNPSPRPDPQSEILNPQWDYASLSMRVPKTRRTSSRMDTISIGLNFLMKKLGSDIGFCPEIF
ncbi:MAG: hypothetical protein ACR2K1_04735, partial [Saprospiraceae bacterium]